jgi:hypothetical protein
MDGLGHQLLARAGVAADEHRDVEVRHPADIGPHPHHGRAIAHQAEIAGLGLLGRRVLVQQQEDAARELDEHPVLQLLGRDVSLLSQLHLVDGDPGPALAAGDVDPAIGGAAQAKRIPADAFLAQRCARWHAWRREAGRQARDLDVMSRNQQLFHEQAFAHASQPGMVQDGEGRDRGHGDRCCSVPGVIVFARELRGGLIHIRGHRCA